MLANKNTLFVFFSITLAIIVSIFRLTPALTASYSGLMSDDAMYMYMARSFYEGNLFAIIHPFWMPLYPLLSAFLFIFVQNWTFASVVTSAISGILLMIPIYFIGKYYANKLVGLLAVFFSIFFFPLVLASHASYAESLQVFLFWMGFLFYLKTLDTNKIIFAFLSGIFWGLTFLTRTEGLFAIISLLFFNLLLAGFIIKKKFKRADAYLNIILFILFFGYLMINYPYLGIPGFVGVAIFLLFLFFLLLKNNPQIKVNLPQLCKITLFVLLGFFIFYFLYNGALNVKYKKPLFLAKATTFLKPAGYYTLNESGTSTWGQDLIYPETFNSDSEFFPKNFHEVSFFKKQNVLLGILENTFFLIARLFYFSQTANLILFFVGIYWLLFKFKDHLKKVFFLLMPLFITFLISIIAIDTSERYVYFASLLIPLGIAFGVNYLAGFFKSLKIKITVLSVLIFLVSYFNLNHLSLRGESVSFSPNFSEYAALFSGRKARAHKEDTKMINLLNLLKDKRVMGRHEDLGFNYRSFFVYSPSFKTLAGLINYARQWKVDYLVASSSNVSNDANFLYLAPKDYPGLKLTPFLLDPETYIYKVIY